MATTIIDCPQGFFQNDTVTPATITDLVSAVESALTNIDSAVTAEANAQASATAAASSATAAMGSQSAAASAATSASTSASNASASAATATTQATNAASSASTAGADATNAGSSATAAAASATAASGSATAAANSATAANTSETNAGTSATNAANSASSASTSATNAAASATSASSSASGASTSASNANTSATNAASSATSASGSASSASTSATNAANSATSASGSASTATTQATNAASSATSAAASATAAQVAAQYNVGRNFIHNPLFSVAQRGAGPFTANGRVYSLDRWATNFVFDTLSTTQVALADADRTAIGDEAARLAAQFVFTGTSAQPNAETEVLQPIEDVYRLSNKSIVVSFWAKAASGTPKIGVSIDQNFGTGGSPSATVTGSGSAVTIGTTWARYSVSLSVPSVSGKTAGTNGDHYTQLNLWLSGGGSNFTTRSGSIGAQSNTVQLWGVQLEVAAAATPLEKRDPEAELRLCQRFCVTGTFQQNTYASATSQFPAGTVYFPTTMRAVPTVTPTFTLQTNGSGAISYATISGFVAAQASSAAGVCDLSGTYLASADL